MRKSEEPKVITSVYLPVSLRDWIKENDPPMSSFIAKAVQEKIDRSYGHVDMISTVKKEIFTLESEILKKSLELTELEDQQKEWKERSLVEEKTTLIRRAVHNIAYDNWREAANDLKETKEGLSTETFNRLVEHIWREHNG